MKAGVRKFLVWLFVFAMMVGVSAAADRRLRQRVEPVYPELAKRINLSGSVRLSVLVSPEGSVRKVEILGGNPVLGQAAVDAVKRWKYEAGPEETLVVVVDFKRT